VHPTTESFKVLNGTLTVVAGDNIYRLDEKQNFTVDPGVEHTFRNDTDNFVAFKAKPPSMKTVKSLYTTWGLDHDGAFGDDGEFGEPDPLHGLILSEDLYDETKITIAPLPVQQVLWATVGRMARHLGYSGIDESYLCDEYWRHHVEQPDLSRFK
jgi:hypothetical protein